MNMGKNDSNSISVVGYYRPHVGLFNLRFLEDTVSCLHVTHDLACPSPVPTVNLLPKYVKVDPNPNPGVQQRACYLKLDTIMAGLTSSSTERAEDPPFNP